MQVANLLGLRLMLVQVALDMVTFAPGPGPLLVLDGRV
jgi:hypothetical protein